MTRPAPWNENENEAIAALYFAMLGKAISGQNYNKAAMIRFTQHVKEGHDCDSHKVTCGNCDQSWCERCDPAPSALCHFCHGRGHLLAPLQARSRGSIEAKLMNCSAAHRDLYPGDTTMDGFGYRALSNYQASLKVAIKAESESRDLDAAIGQSQLNEQRAGA